MACFHGDSVPAGDAAQDGLLERPEVLPQEAAAEPNRIADDVGERSRRQPTPARSASATTAWTSASEVTGAARRPSRPAPRPGWASRSRGRRATWQLRDGPAASPLRPRRGRRGRCPWGDGGVPGLPRNKWPPRTVRRRCSLAVLSQLSHRDDTESRPAPRKKLSRSGTRRC